MQKAKVRKSRSIPPTEIRCNVNDAYYLHGIPIRFQVDDVAASRRIDEQWRPFPTEAPTASSPIDITLIVSDQAPPPPDPPAVSASPDVIYFRRDDQMSAYFPGWGRFDMRLDGDSISGVMARAAVRTYGVFEDMILIALAPLLRRRGYYAIHAFAAAVDERALVIVGDTGAGKTTTGISLLARGAKLIANDSPLLHPHNDDAPRLHAYPGLLSAYPDSIARFPQLSPLLHDGKRMNSSDKISFAADAIWPEAWAWQAQPAALVFPAITPGLTRSLLQPMTAFAALQRLVTQSIEDWDAATIPAQLRTLRQLVEATPAYRLLLAPDISRLPDLLLPLIT